MGVSILENDCGDIAIMYCNTADVAFGPIFSDWEGSEDSMSAFEVVDRFIAWLPADPRTLSTEELIERKAQFLNELPNILKQEEDDD